MSLNTLKGHEMKRRSMTDEKDWADKIAKRIVLDSVEGMVDGFDTNKCKRDVANALREARKIEWPTEEQIKDVAKHEDSDGYFGFIEGCEWLKAWVEERRK